MKNSIKSIIFYNFGVTLSTIIYESILINLNINLFIKLKKKLFKLV